MSIDRNPAPTTEWRAQGIHARTLEAFARYGLLDDFMAAGHTMPHFHILWKGQARQMLDTSCARSEFATMMSCAQPETERILREHLQAMDIPVQWGHTFTGYTVHAVEGKHVSVDVQLQSMDSDSELLVRAAYLVGCDGGGSQVRKAIGATFDGCRLDRRMAVCDVVLEHPLPFKGGYVVCAGDTWHER